ncbi:hypothetical protein C7212DRAFT_165775, partial [Tuber magnatum]
KENNINILCLLAHSSHILQLLDLGIFSLLKSYHCHEITNLVYLDATAKVKKRLFIQAYQKAQDEIFTFHNLHSGWSTTGIFSLNLEKTLNSLQLYHIKDTYQVSSNLASNTLLNW